MKQYRTNYLIITLFLIVLLAAGATVAAKFRLLTDEIYMETTRRLFSEAEHSIDVYMYFIIAYPEPSNNPVNLLVNDLIQAKKRGVDVSVYLEIKKIRESRIAYQRLSRNGINVKFNTPPRPLHAKTIIVDNRYCILGSTNWSRSAIKINYEISVLIDSELLARGLKKYFSTIKIATKPILSRGIPIPCEFLLAPGHGPALFKDHASKAFDLYLLLLKNSWERNSVIIPFNYREIALQLGYPEYSPRISPGKSETEYYHLKIRKPFQTLRSNYSLIKYNTLRDRRVTLLPIKSTKSFTLPYNYWNYGYSTSLSFRAKYMYLISLLETEKNMDYPFWVKSHNSIAATYHISPSPISRGLLELEKANITEITRSRGKPGEYRYRQSNIYRLNPLVSEKQLNLRLKKLQKKYGKAITDQAQTISGRFNEPGDIGKIKTLIGLIQWHGYPTVRKTAEIALSYKKGTGLHSITTITTLLEPE